MATLSSRRPSSTLRRPLAQRPVSKYQVRQFLIAFANSGWSTTKSADQRRAEFHWFETHRIFARLIPAPPPKDSGIPESMLAEAAWQNFCLWRVRVRELWQEAHGLGQSATRDRLLEHALWYSGTRLNPQFQGPMAVKVGRARPLEGFIRVLFHLRDLAGKMRRCKNQACRKPFFFSSHEHADYCSQACGRIGELERKRRAWHRHKHQWRPTKRSKKSQQKKGEK
jgi:hypothetical protein